MKAWGILLAGGRGTRMGKGLPKQFLEIHGRPVALYSFDLFLTLDIPLVVVCAEENRHHFPTNTLFADPGKERMDSVANGLAAVPSDATHILVHDSARPCLLPDRVQAVLSAANEHGAAVLGTRAKNTVKEVADGFVVRTHDRSLLWEVSTPQVVRRDWLTDGLQLARKRKMVVTDDVSCAELLGHPVRLVEDHPSNSKLTTPSDLPIITQELAHAAL